MSVLEVEVEVGSARCLIMPHYRVYSGALSFAQLKSSSTIKYQWISTSSRAAVTALEESNNAPTSPDIRHDPGWLIPVATMDTATQRISEMYKNVIFDDGDFSEESQDCVEVKEEGESQWDESKSRMLGGTSQCYHHISLGSSFFFAFRKLK